MFLNRFADGLTPLDMTATDEFTSLLTSAADLGIPHSRDVRYLSRHTVVRGQRFHFSEWGDPSAPTILLLHGGNQSAHSWDLVSLHLADRFHVVALDQRGHGDSEWSREVDYSMRALVDDAKAFIETLGLDRPTIFGHSMGGRVTLQLTVENPGIAERLVIVDIGPEVSSEGAKVIQNFVSHNLEFDDLDTFIANVQKYDPFRTRAHIERTARYNMLTRADGKFVSKVDHRRHRMHNPDLTLEQVATIDVPVLVVRGEHSDILAPEAAVRFADTLPKGSLVTIPSCGHNVHSGNTLGFLEAVGAFLG